jgi:sulfotransferase family protein
MKDEAQLANAFRKDPSDEQFLEELNTILAPAQEADYQDLPEKFPTLYIVGAPRSGTTLLNQVIATHLDVGYINNLIAAFWKAPVYGIHLSKKLLPSRLQSSYQSNFARTENIHEPHEFGYFWATVFGENAIKQADYENIKKIDWMRLRYMMTNISDAFGSPVIFKMAALGWYIEQVQSILSKSCFVRIRRDPLQNALSILNYRRQFLGDVERWVSLKPREYTWLKKKPYWYQVVGQIYFLEKAMEAQISKVKQYNVIDLTYLELCQNPQLVIEKVKLLLEKNGSNVQIIGQIPTHFEVSISPPDTTSDYKNLMAVVREFYDI